MRRLNHLKAGFAATLTASLFLAGAGSALAQAAAPNPPPAHPAWETRAAAGLTLTRGNSDTLNAVASITTTRKDSVHEWAFGLEGSYGEDHGVKNNEAIKAYGQYNRFLSERLYLFGRADFLYDGIADIDYRVTLSVGPGYYFIKNATTRLSGEVGPGVVFEKIGGQSDTYATIRFAERFEHKFNEKTKMWQLAEFLPRIDDWNDYVINAELGLDTLLSSKLSLRPYIQDTYRSRPAPGRKHNDLKLVVAVAYKF